MRRSHLLVMLAAAAVVSLACGESRPENRGLAAHLPDIVSPETIARALSGAPDDDVRLERAGFRSNKEMAAELPGDLLHFSDDVDEVIASGRVHGYLASYVAYTTVSVTDHVEGRSYRREEPRAGARVAIDLYQSDAAAQRALERRPLAVSGGPIAVQKIGDASIAWPHALANNQPTCPCHFRFRVGPLIAALSISRHGPPPIFGREVDIAKVDLARAIAVRMRKAIEEYSTPEITALEPERRP